MDFLNPKGAFSVKEDKWLVILIINEKIQLFSSRIQFYGIMWFFSFCINVITVFSINIYLF